MRPPRYSGSDVQDSAIVGSALKGIQPSQYQERYALLFGRAELTQAA